MGHYTFDCTCDSRDIASKIIYKKLHAIERSQRAQELLYERAERKESKKKSSIFGMFSEDSFLVCKNGIFLRRTPGFRQAGNVSAMMSHNFRAITCGFKKIRILLCL